MVRATLTAVFGFGPWGGNPCAIVESTSALSAEQMRDVALPEVRVRQHPPEFGPVVSELAELLAALGVSAADVVGPVRVVSVSVSRSKLIVPLASEAVVHGLAPDFERLWSVCDALSTTGVYAFARVGPGRFQARQFPVRAGYVEDPATGVAAGALAAYLARHEGETAIDIGQGFAMGRPSLLHASASSSGPEVYGSAEVLEVVDVPVERRVVMIVRMTDG